MTPLMFAASLGDVHMIGLLLKRGADAIFRIGIENRIRSCRGAGKRDVADMLR